MQFIFGSDNNNGYELLMADNFQDAGKIVELIKLPGSAHMDTCGFITFGPNGNRPLFFRRKKDSGYSREAYFIHGIYGKAEDGHYISEGFKKEYFSRFVSQSWIDSRRANPEMTHTLQLDQELMNKSQIPFKISGSMKREILARIFAGETMILSVDDSLFSDDYARLLMWDLFSYMPQSVIKTATFITAVPDAPGIRIRILPKTVAQTCRDTTIHVNALDYQETEIPRFTLILTEIMQMHDDNPKELQRLYADYHIICNGYSSNYKPMQFCDFMEAYFKGTVELTYQLLNEYFSVVADPNPSVVPVFIRKNLEGHLPALERPKIINELFDAAAFIKQHAGLLKVLYAVNPQEMKRSVAEVYKYLGNIGKTEKALDALNNVLLPQYNNRAGESIPAYQRLFYDTADVYIRDLKDCLGRCDQLKKKLADYKTAYAMRLEQVYYDEGRMARERIGFSSGCAALVREAAAYSYHMEEIVDLTFEEMISEHNQRNPASIRDIDPEGAMIISGLLWELDNPEADRGGVMRRIIEAVNHFGEEIPDELEDPVMRFVLNYSQYDGGKVKRRVRDRFADLEAISTAIVRAAGQNLMETLKFAADTMRYDIALDIIQRVYAEHWDDIENVKPASFTKTLSVMAASLKEAKGDCSGRYETSEKCGLQPDSFAGKNGQRLYKCLQKSWGKRPGGKRLKASACIALAMAAIAVVAGLVVGVVFLLGGFDSGNQGEAPQSSQTTGSSLPNSSTQSAGGQTSAPSETTVPTGQPSASVGTSEPSGGENAPEDGTGSSGGEDIPEEGTGSSDGESAPEGGTEADDQAEADPEQGENSGNLTDEEKE